jgi:hypothetical protein
MRSLLVSLLVLLAAAAQADPVVTISVPSQQIPITQGITLTVKNTSDVEDALDVVIEIKLGSGLDFLMTPQPGSDWSCSRFGTTTSLYFDRSSAGCRTSQVIPASNSGA